MSIDPNLPPATGPAPGWDRLLTAIEFAQRAHQGQLDKAGEPYVWHVLRVGISLLPDIDAAIVGVLHDVLEDCPYTVADLAARGVGPQIEALALLCRTPDQSYEQYIELLARHPLARKVKLADLDDNLDPGRLGRAEAAGHNMAARVKRYHWARACLTAARRSSGQGRRFGPRPGCTDCDSYGCTMNCGPAVPAQG